MISRPLIIPSNFKFKLPRYAEIKLAEGSNCFILQKQGGRKAESNLPKKIDEGGICVIFIIR